MKKKEPLAVVKFSNNMIVIGVKGDSKFIDYIMYICENKKCKIISTKPCDNKTINKIGINSIINGDDY